MNTNRFKLTAKNALEDCRVKGEKVREKRRLKILLLIAVMVLPVLLGACGDDEMEKTLPLAAPQLTEATDITGKSFTMDWTFVEGSVAYLIDLALDESFTEIVEPYENQRISFSEITVENLQSNTTYYFRIRASNRDVTSEYSNTISITTLRETQIGDALKAVADFSIGMAVQVNKLNGQYEEVLLREYDQITSEYEMKMNIMYPSEGNFDFTKSDATVDWAIANNLEVHGHALVWHNATPDWVENFSGTDAAFETMIKDYITTVVTRYKGKVKSWDVVNEAFEDNSGAYRNSVFKQKMGDDYIAKCHQWARDADPDVLLFYNDFSMITAPSKRRAALDLMKDFQDRGVPIDGIGYQMHISYDWPPKSDVAAAAKEATDLGLLLHFSELDVRANPRNDLTVLTIDRAVAHQTKYKEVVEVYNALPETSKFALTIWGMRDEETWLTSFWGHIDWPLLYNNDFSVKRAHTGFLEGLK